MSGQDHLRDEAEAKYAEMLRLEREAKLRGESDSDRMREEERAAERRIINGENRYARRVARAFARRLGE